MSKLAMLVVSVLAVSAAHAQTPPPPSGSTVVASTPGKAAIVSTAEITATVVAIDKATRTVSLKGPKGRVVDVTAGDEVKNFDQIRVGDRVVVKYAEALTLELKKTKAPLGAKGDVAVVRAAPDSRPAGAVGREITVLADVVAVDPKQSIISLKGPQGNIVDLKVQNQDHFKVVKVGDQVEAVYAQALAMAVTPAPAAEKKSEKKAEKK